eukprot:COSAG01_NODE_30708_length_609_cov_44.131115_2_plen_63_part_01
MARRRGWRSRLTLRLPWCAPGGGGCRSLRNSAGEEGYLEHIDHVMAAGTVYIDPTDEFSGNTP